MTRQAGGAAGQYRASKAATAPTEAQVNALAQLVDYLEASNAKRVYLSPPPQFQSNQTAGDTPAAGVEIEEIVEESDDEFYDAPGDNPEDYFVAAMGNYSEDDPGFCGIMCLHKEEHPFEFCPAFNALLPEQEAPYEMPELSEGVRNRFNKEN